MSEPYRVDVYSDGSWCVIDSKTDKIVTWFDHIGWKTAFDSREEAEEAARRQGQSLND